MDFRLAVTADLPRLKAVYRSIIERMDREGIQIWDEIYPGEFFGEDIAGERLYVLTEGEDIVAAFALCDSGGGADALKWKKTRGKVLYIDRLGVNVAYSGKGIGGMMLGRAAALAKELGASGLRLFVVDINTPAINLYLKSGFQKADGVYDEVIDEDLVLHEFGFEMEIE